MEDFKDSSGCQRRCDAVVCVDVAFDLPSYGWFGVTPIGENACVEQQRRLKESGSKALIGASVLIGDYVSILAQLWPRRDSSFLLIS